MEGSRLGSLFAAVASNNDPMNVWISHLGHALPGPALPQADIVDWLEPRLTPDSDRGRLRRFAARTGVASRHSVLDLFGAEGNALYPRHAAHADAGLRSRAFARHSVPLATAAVRQACPGALPAITHVIVATCTGAVAPGLDLQLVEALGLSRQVRRTMITFMGCYAAVPAMRAAWDACRADPTAIVLVVCCELSSLHFQPGPQDDALIGACLFGDGATAAIVQSSEEPLGTGLAIIRDASQIVPDTAAHMAWQASATGFTLRLSPAIGASIGTAVGEVVDQLRQGTPQTALRWAIHPGSLRMVNDAERLLGLLPTTLDPSRAALADAGNRSSATVLAVLEKQLTTAWNGPLALLACGPGLTIDGLLLERTT